MSSSTLQITDATAVNSGEYTCTATNKAGSDELTAKLIVSGKIQCVCKKNSKQGSNVLCMYTYKSMTQNICTIVQSLLVKSKSICN